MTLKGFGKLYEHVAGKVVLYIPAAVVKDSAFPFKVGAKLQVRIAGKKLVIEQSDN